MIHRYIPALAAALAPVLLVPVLLSAAPQDAEQTARTFDQATVELQTQLDEALTELESVYAEIEQEKLPLARRLNELEAQVAQLKSQRQEAQALLDNRGQGLFNLTEEIKQRQQESDYLADLLADYVGKVEAGLHISEFQRYDELLTAAKDAAENASTPRAEVFARQATLVEASIERLHDAIGGRRFAGRATNPNGIQRPGTFLLVGPSAIFRDEDGGDIGTAEERVNSAQPTIQPFSDPLLTTAAGTVAESGTGTFPFDPTLGDAHKIALTEETFLEHVQKGGLVMVPIFAMAGTALLVALFKWLGLSTQRRPSKKQLRALFDAIAKGDEDQVRAEAARLKGPAGRMLAAGVEHIREPRELVEEVMYEHLLNTKLKLNRFLPFIAICAASAPLLGLLGTVTGIINTFKLITVFGSGDVKSLSGGISEALITTKFGLIVAIPSLLLHAFLSRKARGIAGEMETAAVALTNQLTLTPMKRSRGGASDEAVSVRSAPDPELVRAQVSEILGEILGAGAGGVGKGN
ncbi:MAG: MotA/TolQ/ExbB proton channel family protein [Planctomycetota bacterium]|jgi:biopolymer transport protein ExbB